MKANSNNTSVFILAAGQSSRFNTALSNKHKLLQILPCGLSVLQRVYDCYENISNNIYIVCNAEFENLFKAQLPQAHFIINANAHLGMGSSLKAGLRELQRALQQQLHQRSQQQAHEYLLITLADKPFIQARSIQLILDAAEVGKVILPFIEQTAQATFTKQAQSQQKKQRGHPLLIHRDRYAELLNISDKQGASSIYTLANSKGLLLNDLGICFDIDSPEDLQRATSLFY